MFLKEYQNDNFTFLYSLIRVYNVSKAKCDLFISLNTFSLKPFLKCNDSSFSD